jgi:hypothetical protein
MIEQFDETNVTRAFLGLPIHALMTLRTALRSGSNFARGTAQFAFQALKTISSTSRTSRLYCVSSSPRFGCVMSVVIKWRRLELVRLLLLMRCKDDVVRCSPSSLLLRHRILARLCFWSKEAVMYGPRNPVDPRRAMVFGSTIVVSSRWRQFCGMIVV